MNRILLTLASLLWASVAVAGMAGTAGIKVTVTNPLDAERNYETVEISWKAITSKVKGINPENVIVSREGKQLPSQVITEGSGGPRTLIFQASVGPKGKAEYTISVGKREDYIPQAYGRFVPERKDDYAWENNVVGFRIYGPALRDELVTAGIDYWAKNTSQLVIDKWYARDLSGQGSYHADSGEGCDCYKVGPTLGCGASGFYVDGQLVPGENYESWERLDNGPLRTSVKLTYRPVEINGERVTLERIITLDANTNFNRFTERYAGATKPLQIAVGVVVHENPDVAAGDNFLAVWEPASDSQSGRDGYIGCAVILPHTAENSIAGDNLILLSNVSPGKELVFHTGAATSKNGVINHSDGWLKAVEAQKAAILNPLKVTLK